MSDGNPNLSLAEALASAQAEMEPTSSVVADTDQSLVEAQASGTEQATAGSEDTPTAEVKDGFSDEQVELAASLMSTDDGESQNGSDSGAVVPGSDDFWNLSVDVQTVNGPQAVTIQELSDGYLRQADYTQKTQSLAEQRKASISATEFYDNFQKDPAGFINSLAVQAGLIDADAIPASQVDMVKIPTQEELDARVTELVEERIEADPRVQTAEVAAAQAQIDTEFTRLEQEYNLPMSKELRDDIIQEAVRSGSADLEGILTKRLVRTRNKQSQADVAQLASTARPGSQPSGVDAPSTNGSKNPTMKEAWAQAKVAAAQQ